MSEIAERMGEQTAETPRREMFLRLMSEYRRPLARLSAAYLRDAQDQEDLVQEIALALWQAAPRFRGDSSERTWLYRIAHNTAITAAAKIRRRGKVETTPEDPPEPPSPAEGHDENLIQAQRREWLLQAIRQMPAIDRQILTLHLEGLSHSEIQAITGLSEAAIATRLSRQRDRLTAKHREDEGKRA
jgi:RNA polymerase sigma-70 factor (ECF subfamily)